MQVHEILIIKNDTESYGISTEEINHIARVPLLMPLPLRPKFVRGLCAVAGTIVSLVDLNLLLNFNEVDYEASATRLLSLNGEHSENALLVSEVYDTVLINQQNIEYINQENNPIVGVYKYKEMLIQVMSLDILFGQINRVAIESKEVKNGKIKESISNEEENNRFLVFSLAKEKFALNIEYLQEIILADIQITAINNSKKDVLGLITIRNELLTVIDLRIYYDFSANRSDKNRILVASYEGKRVGLLIDNIIDIENFSISNIEYMDDLLEKSKISGVVHTEDDSIMSFFDYHVLEDIFSQNESFIDENFSETDTVENTSYMEVIIFKLLDKEYAFNVGYVDEIIDLIEATEVAFTNTEIAGIINIRGQIVTLVSLFEKLGLETVIDKDAKIIVCNINETRIGFVVDSVSDILEIQESEVRHDESDETFSNILYLENGKRLVLAMEVDTLITTGEK